MAALRAANAVARKSWVTLVRPSLLRYSFSKDTLCKRTLQTETTSKAKPKSTNNLSTPEFLTKPKLPNIDKSSLAFGAKIFLRASLWTAFGFFFVLPVAAAWLVYLSVPRDKCLEERNDRKNSFMEDQIFFHNKCLSEDSEEWKRVDGVLKKLVLANQHHHDGLSEFDWTVTIICSGSEENAFAYPNGHCYITTKFLSTLDTDDKLANILAKEMAHVYLSHAQEKLCQSSELSKMLVTLFSALPLPKKEQRLTALTPIIKFLATESLQRTPYTLDEELEADKAAASMVAKASYDPREGAAMLILRDAKERNGDGIIYSQYYDIHPHVHERARQLVSVLVKSTNESSSAGPPNPIEAACAQFDKMEESHKITL